MIPICGGNLLLQYNCGSWCNFMDPGFPTQSRRAERETKNHAGGRNDFSCDVIARPESLGNTRNEIKHKVMLLLTE